jgi:hypothetical protein
MEVLWLISQGVTYAQGTRSSANVLFRDGNQAHHGQR